MNGIWYYLYAFVIIWILSLGLKKKLEKHNFEINFPIIMWRTTRLRGFIEKISNLSPKFWKWFFNIGIIVSYIAMVVMTIMLVQSLSTVFETPSVSIVLPGVEVPGSPMYVPFTYGFLAIISVLVIHEFSHGIASRCEKISIKSIGLLLVAVLPGAFVEPDEDELEVSSKMSKLRVYCAGSVANISLAAIALICTVLISSLIVPAVFYDDGMKITRVMENSPANGVLHESMVIKSFNGQTFNNYTDYSQLISSFKPNEDLSIGTNEGTFTVHTTTNPSNSSKGYIGVMSNVHYEIYDSVSSVYGNDLPWIWFMLIELFKWIFILNLGIGLFNLLPIKPLDGGHMFEILLSTKLPEENYAPIVRFVSIFLAMVIIVSLVVGFI